MIFANPFFVCHDFDLKIFDIGIFFADGHLQKLLLTTCRDVVVVVVVVVVEVVAADGGAPPVFFSKTKTIDLIQLKIFYVQKTQDLLNFCKKTCDLSPRRS